FSLFTSTRSVSFVRVFRYTYFAGLRPFIHNFCPPVVAASRSLLPTTFDSNKQPQQQSDAQCLRDRPLGSLYEMSSMRLTKAPRTVFAVLVYAKPRFVHLS
ncbi:unnamed protein product, partial [Ascophyllum nodosum]